MKRFEDRNEAGYLLAERLAEYKTSDPVILALPRGGIPIAKIIASSLHAPLDLIFIRKIGVPGNEEFAVGAVAEDEKPLLNEELISHYNLDRKIIAGSVSEQIKEIRSRSKRYRKVFKPISFEGRTVIVVDDGLATGASMKAALTWLKTKVVKEIIVAVPVSSREGIEEIKPLCNEVISLIVPPQLWSVGSWYHNFKQLTDEEVLDETFVSSNTVDENDISLYDQNEPLKGLLQTPSEAKGLILFAHGSGSNYKSPRNQKVAKALHEAGFATMLFDLLTAEESCNRRNVFDIDLLARRLTLATEWAKKNFPNLPMGYFGASTGAAAALKAAADREHQHDIFAIVSRGGRPDLALESLPQVKDPVLLIVGKEDDLVIPLNKLARNKLKNCQMEIIPKAGHLFEEPGTMEQVIELAVGWFNQYVGKKKIKKLEVAKENIVMEIEKYSTPFHQVSELKDWIENISHHRIVMFGEATHGTKEFYYLRSEVSKILIDKYGFDFIAVEGDWPDCHKLNDYIYSDDRDPVANVVRDGFHRWPTWMWANEEIPSIIEWMKMKKGGGFYGLDVYSLFESIDEIKKSLSKYDSNLAYKMMEGYNCFESFERNEISYAQSLLRLPAGCQDEVIHNLRELLRLRLQDTKLTPGQLFDVQQNARVINNAEKYYRTMLTGGPDSWNIRDNHMLETLENLLNHHSREKMQQSKAIIWAHNTHVGDYHATDMGESGYVNLGGLAREKFGVENVYLVGFGTHHGKVTAGKAWKTPQETMVLPTAQAGTYEDYFHKAAINLEAEQFLTRLDHLEKLSPLYHKLGHRAVGVVYDPEYEKHGHNYVPTELANRYDAFIFVDETNALKPLGTTETKGQFPETYPLGQ